MAEITNKTGPNTNGSVPLGRRAGILGSLFGCKHRELGRPMTRNGETYRACLSCGAQRYFNLITWEASGPYYYRASSSFDLHQLGTTAAQPKPHRLRVVKAA